jgi:hydroxymethylpyrimidine kinase/phosphomethylpyrimidine kinase
MGKILFTIGGSDSSGGAGIQADIKTFAALGFHGTSAITAATAQNTLGVKKVYPLDPEAVTAQMEALAEDFEIAAAKTGMLCSKEIVSKVAEFFEGREIPLVVDPVMAAEAGGQLLEPQAVDLLCEKLIPLARVVTPNIFEAEAISGVKVRDEESALEAGVAIVDMGAEAVVVTGGHLEGDDVLVTAKGHLIIRGERLAGGNHGVGCTYSAALTAGLARGLDLKEAAKLAKKFAAASVKKSVNVGKGASPVNPLGEVLVRAERFDVLMDLERGIEDLLAEPAVRHLIPEVGSNLGMATPEANGPQDVAAVEGRMVKVGSRVKACGAVRFGASSHVARIILSAMSFDPKARAGMNIRYGPDVLEAVSDLGLTSSSFSRDDEPSGSKTMSWGTAEAIKRFRSRAESNAGPTLDISDSVPQVIWDRGGPGKEPMVRLLGASASEVAAVAVEIATSPSVRREPIN